MPEEAYSAARTVESCTKALCLEKLRSAALTFIKPRVFLAWICSKEKYVPIEVGE